jgi:hypothetical protein
MENQKNIIIATQQKIQQYIKNGSNGDLDLHNTPITKLPDNLKRVDGDLNLYNTPITTLPDNLTVNGFLDLSNTKITTIPDNLTVGGWLDFSNTKITSLPDNLTVSGNLYLHNTKITSIPISAKITGTIYGLKKEITNEVIKIQCECSLFSGGKSEKCCNVFFGCPLWGLKNIHYTNTPVFKWDIKNLRIATKNDRPDDLRFMITSTCYFKSYDEFKEFLQNNQNSHIIFYLNQSNKTIWWEDNTIRYAIYEEKQNIEKSYEMTQYNCVINNQFYKIYQVKRLSDGQLFTVGDRVKTEQYYNKSITIESFVEDSTTILFQSQDGFIRSLDYFTIVTSSFPKWMLVSNDNIHWETRYVIADFGELFNGGGYQVISQGYEKSYFSNLNWMVESFRFAKDITEEKITELTLDQIAEKFNIPVSQLKIKK